jgi:hypothetical protein
MVLGFGTMFTPRQMIGQALFFGRPDVNFHNSLKISRKIPKAGQEMLNKSQ